MKTNIRAENKQTYSNSQTDLEFLNLVKFKRNIKYIIDVTQVTYLYQGRPLYPTFWFPPHGP